MISIIYGSKGAGKTKQIIDWANSSVQNSKGDVAYITDTKAYTREIDLKIRYVACEDYLIKSQESFIAFVQGMLAANHDIVEIFIDGIARITKEDLADLKNLFKNLETISDITECNFILTISSDMECMPDFVRTYVK